MDYTNPNKSVIIRIRVPEIDYVAWQNVAKDRGTTVSSLIRLSMNDDKRIDAERDNQKRMAESARLRAKYELEQAENVKRMEDARIDRECRGR